MSFSLVVDSNGEVQRPQLVPPSADAHKYSRGFAMVFSGPPLRTGASRLAAQAALAVGAGAVTLVGSADALAEQARHVTAIMLREWAGDTDPRVTALAIGPSAGVGPALAEEVVSLSRRRIPIVLDADAMTSFADASQRLFAVLGEHVVLTPHEGELARLFPKIMLVDRRAAVLAAAAQSGANVLLKGPVTLIATPCGRIAVNRHAAPWLATAGSGDVLTGLICGIMAQGVAPFDAACIAAWLHGEIAIRHGPGLTADLMVRMLPAVLSGCLKGD